jgi:hypothetical protein
MTEEEWLCATDPMPMLRFLPAKSGDRKLRLFAVACYRQMVRWLVDRRAQEAFSVAERYADGTAERCELLALLRQHQLVPELDALTPSLQPDWSGMQTAAAAAYWAVTRFPRDWADRSSEPGGPLCDILRCIFGDSFRPVAIDSAWLTPTVKQLARAANEDRLLPSGDLERDRLAVLAGALEDAGCTDPGILEHLRGPGPHVRGCWVVDLILGKK